MWARSRCIITPRMLRDSGVVHLSTTHCVWKSGWHLAHHVGASGACLACAVTLVTPATGIGGWGIHSVHRVPQAHVGLLVQGARPASHPFEVTNQPVWPSHVIQAQAICRSGECVCMCRKPVCTLWSHGHVGVRKMVRKLTDHDQYARVCPRNPAPLLHGINGIHGTTHLTG